MAGKIEYSANDQIISGHVSGTLYSLTFAQEVLDVTGQFIKTTNVSINGSEETEFLRTDKFWSIKASYLTAALVLEWQEFFYSTKLGQSFTYWPDAAVSGTSYTVVMVTKEYKPKRVGTTDNDFSFIFQIKLEV